MIATLLMQCRHPGDLRRSMITRSRARLSNEPDLHAADILKASGFQHLGDFVCALVRGRCAVHGHDCKLINGLQT
jgi:hypothetical protein